MTAAAPIEFLDEVDSTNAEARRRAEAGEVGPIWIAARRQTAGRGRRGRVWETGAGNLAATLLMRTARPPAEAAQVSFVAALAAAALADAFVPPAGVSLKWPNDLLIGGRKAAGILVESGAYLGGALWLAVGVGVNLATAPLALERPATTFAEHMDGPAPTPSETLPVLAAAFARFTGLWDDEGFPAIAAAWTARAHGLGQACTARLARETLFGVAEGLDPDGAFRLRMADGAVVKVTAGDVFFEEA